MSDTAAPPQSTDTGTDARSVDRRRSLPGGRAVVGAFLVTLAAVGIFTAYLRSNAVPTTTYVIATRDLAPGDVLTAGDLTTVPIDLPNDQAGRTIANPEAMVDRIVLSPLFQGELIGLGDTGDARELPGTSSLTVPIETSRALGGNLAAGDRVDVIATFEETTRFVAVNLPIIETVTDGTVTSVTLATSSPTTVLAVANAIDTATVFLALNNTDADASTTKPVKPGAEVLNPADGDDDDLDGSELESATEPEPSSSASPTPAATPAPTPTPALPSTPTPAPPSTPTPAPTTAANEG